MDFLGHIFKLWGVVRKFPLETKNNLYINNLTYLTIITTFIKKFYLIIL